MNFFTALTVLFIGLKLTNYIDWSWWLVLSPFWGGIVFIVLTAFFAVLSERNRRF